MSPSFMTTFQNSMLVHYIQEFGHLTIMLMITNGGSTNYLHTTCDMQDQAHTQGGGSSTSIFLFIKKSIIVSKNVGIQFN
jgi:hypothetical protein